MSDPTELDDLDGVTQHPGWHRIKGLLAEEWGPTGRRYIDTLERMANNTDREQAIHDLQLVIKVRREIEGFFMGVEARARQLRDASTPVASPSRRGLL